MGTSTGMPEPHVTLDPATLTATELKLREPLEDQLTSALRDAAHRLRDGYAGESADVVQRRLLDRAREALHPDIAAGFEPDPAELRRVAEAIVNGGLTH
jgi:hypothetical protein